MYRQTHPSISPNYVNYRINGTGRDTYISTNNGGYYRASSLSSKSNPARNSYIRPIIPTSPAPRSVKYISDGTGRDRYIGISDGGLHALSLPSNSKKPFERSLRTYSRPSTVTNSNDFLIWANQVWQPERNKSASLSKSKLISDSVKRLSTPKNKSYIMDSSANLTLSDMNSSTQPTVDSFEIDQNLPKSDIEDEGFGSFEEAEMVEDEIDIEKSPEIMSLDVEVDECMRPKQPLTKSAHFVSHPELIHLSSQIIEKVQISSNTLKDYEIQSNKSLLNCVKGERDSRMFQKEMRMKQLYLDYATYMDSLQKHEQNSEQSICRYENTDKYGVSQLSFANLSKDLHQSFDMKEIGEHLTSICDHFCCDVWNTLYLRQVAFNYAAIKKTSENTHLVCSTASLLSKTQDLNGQIPEIDSSILTASPFNDNIPEPEETNNQSDASMGWATNLDWLIT